VASLLGFGAVVFSTPYWDTHRELAIGLAVTLLVIPAYSATLIRRLNEARQRADDANRAKSDFLSNMSHEIRTPLNGILGMTELLRLRPLEPEDKECVDIIHASGNALARQINEILDLSKIEAGQLTIESIDFDLYALISTTLRIFKTQVDGKQLQLSENLDPRTPYLLHGDPHRLQQVIINLVGNAIKFTEHGFVSIQVHPMELDAQRTLLRFEIIDTGIGIDPDRINAIFDPFTQADSSVSRNYGGTGLGTTICKKLVELMGGEIGIQSTPGVGTTFWFDIPFEIASADANNNDLSWASACKVLYLNPVADTSSDTVNQLRAFEISFDTVTSVEQAARRLRTGAMKSEYHAIVIDGMPYDSALIELLTNQDRNGSAITTPVVLLNSEQYPPSISDLEKEWLFSLPSDTEKRLLFNALHACYSKHSSEGDILHIASRQANRPGPAKVFNILVADDNATNRIVVKRMLDKMGHRCTTVSDGEEALNSLEQFDYDVVFLDKNMPGLGGIETYQAYSLAHGGKHNAEFVILTADATDECRNTCREAGIGLFLTKPVSLTTLQNTLSALTRPGKGTTEEVAAEPVTDVLDIAELPIIDEDQFEKLNLLSDGNIGFILEMIHNFETDANRDLKSLESSIANHDCTTFRDAAHALKGCALYLGLSRLAQVCLNNQDVSKDDFDANGIARLQVIRRTLNDSIRSLHDKADSLGAHAQNY
jgi:two-component system sensor histidine kinase RpfC